MIHTVRANRVMVNRGAGGGNRLAVNRTENHGGSNTRGLRLRTRRDQAGRYNGLGARRASIQPRAGDGTTL